MDTSITVFALDDHPIVLDGLSAMFIGNTSVNLAATFNHSHALLDKLKIEQPNVLLLDITLPELSGIEVCKILTEEYPRLSVLMLSAKTDEYTITESIKAGAKGFLPKNAPKDEIEKAIKRVQAGKMYFGEGINDTIFKGYVKNLTTYPKNLPSMALSEREKEIIKLFADGLLYKEIADRLSISIKTVEAHKAKIMKKIEAKSTAALVKYAIKEGITSLD